MTTLRLRSSNPSPSTLSPASTPQRRVSRRQIGARLAAGAGGGLLLSVCGPLQRQPDRGPTGLTGTFEFIAQNWPPLNSIHEQSIASFNEKNPGAKVSFTMGDMRTKMQAAVAAGSGPDGMFHYSGYWRGMDAKTIMLPLTPILFRQNELERIFYKNLLHSVPSRDNEVYFLPAMVGLGGAGILYNVALLNNANIDPKTFTTLDAILTAATKVARREGGIVTRAGLLHAHTASIIERWIIDQGGKFYDEKNLKWTWQTLEAERAMQWLLDLYDKHGVTWRKQPDGVSNALGEGHAAMMMTGPFSLSGYAKTHPDTKLEDRPLPGFVAGKQPNFFEPELAGYSLSALLKPDDPRAKVGAAYFRHLLSPENVMLLANEYSGCILINGLYEDPRFKQTTFAAQRAKMPEQWISKILLINTGVNPYDFNTYITKVVNGELSIRAALADAQQVFNVKEEEAQRNMR